MPAQCCCHSVGQALGNAADGQAGGVRGDDRAGLANLRDAREQRALDLEIFRDDFDDPVRFGAELQIVFEIARNDAIFEAAREKRRGLGFCGGSEAGAHDSIADFGAGNGKPARLFLGAGLRRNDIEQRAPDAGIGDVRGDPRAHGSRAQDHDFFDGSFHNAVISGMIPPLSMLSSNSGDARACAGYRSDNRGSTEKRQASRLR